MLDNEPDMNDNNPAAATSDEAAAGEPQAARAAAPRRRRAATRKAGPPTVSAEPTGGDQPTSAPAMTAESTSAEQQPPTEATGGDQPAPAKKAARKRATKSAGDATRTPRKRASKKSATAPADAEVPAESPPTEPGSEPGQSPGTEVALDEIRVALAAEPASVGLTGAERPTSATGDALAPAEPSATQDVPADSGLVSSPDRDADTGTEIDSEIDSAGGDAQPELAQSELAQSELAQSEVVESEVVESDDEDEAGDESDTDESDADESDADESDTDESGTTRRRRRRRGGRRRRRGGGDSDGDSRDGSAEQSEAARQAESAGRETDQRGESGESAKTAGSARAGTADTSEADASDDDGNDEEGSQRRRRRRRRRRGEDNGPSADDPAEVVVRVREPRSRQKAAQEVTGIEGSTRMEAKRQRRREGREAGRRRAPILSEAEFLARRESVVRKMVIRQLDHSTGSGQRPPTGSGERPSTGSGDTLSQIAVLENDILVEHYVDRESAASLIGNVYLGRVQNVLPSMEAAFIDIGRGRNAVLYAGEVDWDAYGATGQQRKVENVLKSGQSVLVQVTKDPVGAKGARLTSHVTLPGRYIVYAPGGHLSGISRKLPDNERKRLKSVLNDLVPESASVIVRTAAEGASEDELVRDVNRLKAQWEDIERKVKAGSAPKLLYGEPDLTVRIVRDLFTEDFAELIIQGNGSAADAYDAVDGYVGHVAPHLRDRMRRWDSDAEGDLFAKYRLDEQIAKALERKVFLPSGGSLVIDRTEAMTVIDVNTGKFTGSGGNLEATVTSNNLEAAEEIVRQLRLRDIGGIIVIDFIDMVLPSNRELLLRRLVECLGRDRTRHQVAEVTSLGLVQMTRKKIGTGLFEAFTIECEHCHGRGYQIADMPVETQKQPDGGSRDGRGGGRDRGRGRGSQSGSGNGGSKPARPVPAPPLHGPEPEAESAQRPDLASADASAPESTPAG